MAIKDLVLYPDDVLRVQCRPVEEITDDVRALVKDMIDTMYDAPGIGLAAPQIGSDLRICVIDTSAPDDPDNLWVLINPEIIQKEGKIVWEEGCLSIPGVFHDVKRAESVTVRATDINGDTYEIEATGLEAVCLQHEIDHLNGVLFLDHLSRLKLRMAKKTYKRTRLNYLADLKEKKKKREQEANKAKTPNVPSGEAPSTT